jgi:3-deoxy-D-manno-octulosonic-acid transferase
VLGCVSLFLARSETDAGRLRDLGARRVLVCGNLKFDVPPPAADAAVLSALREVIAGRRVLLTASTHPGEEESIVAAHRKIAEGGTRLFTILAPRHPQRSDAIAAVVTGAGLKLARRSHGDRVSTETDVYLADTIGEMGTWYRLADVAFLGGSMVPRGGQNPIEPAKLGVPIVHGEHVGNFRDVYGALAEANAVTSVRDAASLAAAVVQLLGDDKERERRAADARACVERFAGALDHTLEALRPYLEPLRNGHEASART